MRYVILTNEGIDYSDLNVNIILKSSEFSKYIVCEIIELINDIAAEYKKVIIQIKKIEEEYSFVLLNNGFKRIRKKANSEVVKYERYNNCK